MPSQERHVEVFVTNSALCEQVIMLIQQVAGNDTQLIVRDVREEDNGDRARELGLRSFPAVVVDDQVLPFDAFSAVRQMLATVDWSQVFKAS